MKIICSLDLSAVPDSVAKLEETSELILVESDRKDVIEHIGDADVYFCDASVKVDAELLNHAKNLKLVATPSTGTDHLDRLELKKRNIQIYDIATEFSLINQFTATSELSFCLMLNLIRKTIEASKKAQSGEWARERFSGFQLFGKTLGVIGLGRLGKISANIASGFGMNVIAYDPAKPDAPNVTHVNLDDLLAMSDIVSLHVHLSENTKHLISANEIALMKPSAFLINTSRGGIIDETALLDALKNKQIAGAGLDVIDGEWLNPSELFHHPLIKYSREHSNLLIVPHIGGSTSESITLARRFMAEKIVTFVQKNI